MYESQHSKGEVYGFDKNDFAERTDKDVLQLSHFKVILKELLSDVSSEKISNLETSLAEMLVLSACHLEPAVWTTELSNKIAQEVLQLLCQIGACSIPELLHGPASHSIPVLKTGLFDGVLKRLAPNLKTNTWKEHYSEKQAFSWCLFQVKFPYLSEYLDWVVFPPLVFLDDHIVDNKILGVRCFAHIIDNVAASKLRWNGIADLMYNALEHQLYLHEEILINVLHPCLLSMLSVLEKSPSQADQPRKFSKYDKIFERILIDMELTIQISARRAFSRHLPTFILKMDITVVRYMKRVLRVIQNYLEVPDVPNEDCRFNALQILQSFFKVAWPRIPNNLSTILKILLRFLHDITSDDYSASKEVKENLLCETKECLRLLKKICGEEFEVIFKSLSSIDIKTSQTEAILELFNTL